MRDFTFHRPDSLQQAAALLEGSGDGTFMAGGQTLIPVMKQGLAAPEDIIDLGAIDALRGISAANGILSIGAMTTHAAVAASGDVQNTIPALAVLAGEIGDPHVRNRGTIGGSVANNDPAADYPAAVVGLKADVVTSARTIAADEFFVDLFETALDEGEIVTRVDFRVPQKAAYVKFPNPASRYALAGVFVSRWPNGSEDGAVRVAVTGAGPCVFRAEAFEEALSSDFSPAALDGNVQPADGLNSDIHASAEYRAHLIAVLAKRAVQAAG